jgi:AcrR family transcriptional regulator
VPRLNADTRAEIRAVALELFAANGFGQTSLREIAERLGISKAALYYHFASKSELLAELVAPLVEDIRAFSAEVAETGSGAPRRVLEEYFDLCFRHRRLFQVILRDVNVLSQLDTLSTLMHWRAHLDSALVGSDAPADRVRAVIALGGLQDCAVLLPDLQPESIRTAAVDSALRALLPGPPGEERPQNG